MERVCDRCGAQAADDARFCAACGAPLRPGLAQRKIATMVFADLVDSTAIAVESDPEHLRGRLEPFFAVARAALEEHGGTIEKYIGDAVLAVFGVPRAHGDDPDRAVVAALTLIDRVRELDDSLAVRIGIETGDVLSTGDDGDLAVTGEAVNVAARLQEAAAPGEILVGERAADACRLASLEPSGHVTAKGMPAPLATWRAVGTSSTDAGEESVPLLGRDDDLELLRLVYRRAVREHAPQLVMVTGEAGIGKSRLVKGLIESLGSEAEPPRVLAGHNPPYGRGIAFWALGEVLRDAAGASADDPVDDVRRGLEYLLSGLGADDAGETAAALTVSLRGSSGDGERSVEDVLKRAWRRFMALLATERPLLLAIDDAHWADDGLLDLLEDAAFGLPEARVVIVCTSRPELHERRPDFGRAARNVSQLELPPLEREATTELVRLLLNDAGSELAERVAAASGGNPFFAEEVARSISTDASHELADLPDTVQAAIAARMDLLPPPERRALQYAAVLGEGFLERRLEDLLGRSQREELDGLERKALVQERVSAGPGRYEFRHQLIRDVAYAALPRGERAQLHERAAADIRTEPPERLVELAELVAYHLAQAAELEPGPARCQAAHDAAVEAAEVAGRRGAQARTQQLYEQAGAFATTDEATVAALRNAGTAALQRWRGDQGLPLLREAAAVAERAGLAGAAAAAYGFCVEAVARMGGITGDLPEPEVRELQERAEGLVPDDDFATRAQLMLNHVWIAWRFNRPDEIGDSAHRALELARNTDDARLQSMALDAVAASEWLRRRYEAALTYSRERVDLLRTAPHTPALEVERNDSVHMMVESLLQVGSYEEAARWATRSREQDLTHGLAYSAWSRGILPSFFLGRWDESLEMAHKFRDAWLAEERPPLAAMAAAVAGAGAIYGYRGDESAAAEWFGLSDVMKGGKAGHRGGIRYLQADVAIHHGLLELALDHVDGQEAGFWWHTVYWATRAEALVLAGRPEASAALDEVEREVDQQPHARAVALRARGLHAQDEALIERSRGLFAELACPYQEARCAWLLGGEPRARSMGVFERLGTTPPAELAAAPATA